MNQGFGRGSATNFTFLATSTKWLDISFPLKEQPVPIPFPPIKFSLDERIPALHFAT